MKAIPAPAPRLPDRHFFINRLLWAAIAVIAAIDAWWLYSAHIRISANGLGPFAIIIGTCLLLSLATHYIKREDTLCIFGNAVNQMIAMGLLLGIFNNLLARLNFPLVDAQLLAADRLLHFDWLAYIGWCDAHPHVLEFLSNAYQSYGLEGILLLCLLFLCNHPGQAQRFLCVMFLTAFSCAVIGAFFPAAGSYFSLPNTLYPDLRPTEAFTHIRFLLQLRQSAPLEITLPAAGVVMFPSFHAALAVFLTYASLPLRRVRLLAIPLNTGMLFSTPVIGGHYLIDVLAGVAITLLFIAIAEILLPRRNAV